MRNRNLLVSLALITAVAACKKSSNDEDNDEPKKTAEVSKTPTATVPAGTDSTGQGTSFRDAAGAYTVDSDHTQIIFQVKHLTASRQFGMFTRVEGKFSIDSKNIGASKVEISIPTGSLFSASKKRDDHLRGPDFFDAKQFPTITFKSNEVKASGAQSYSIAGDLSLHGVTKGVTIELEHGGSAADPEMMGGRFRSGFNGKFVIKRSDFGMNYMPGGLGEEVTIWIALEGTRN